MDGSDAAGEARMRGIIGREIFLEELEIELDRREGVFDLVREPAGERADLRQALGVEGAALEAEEPAIKPDPAGGGEQKARGAADDHTPAEPMHMGETLVQIRRSR
jgi:hypothetical protein